LKHLFPTKLLFALALLLTPGIGFSPAVVEAKANPSSQSSAQPSGKSIRGRGIALLDVDYETGRVTSCKVVRSTGNEALDQAAVNAFSKHLFTQRTVRGRVRAPMTFSLTQREGAAGSVVNSKRARRSISEVTSTISFWTPRRPSLKSKGMVASAKAGKATDRPLRATPLRATLVSR